MLPHNIIKSLVSFQVLKKKKIKHMLGMNLKLNQYSILLSMFSIRYGSTFIVCVSFCKNKRVLLLCFISLCNSHNCQDLMVIKVSCMGS